MPHLLCFGFGYTARALARTLLSEGWSVTGTSRDGAGSVDIDNHQVPIVAIDQAEDAINQATHLLTSAPPSESGDPILERYQNLLTTRGTAITWMGYLGTTGVYGDHEGALVDETSICKPSSPRAARRLAAEKSWLDLYQSAGLPTHIFRLAGIYGPGRNALKQLQAGTARRLYRAGQVFSRIHRDDIVEVLRASMQQPQPGTIYNVCDDQPVGPGEVVEFASEISGYPMPPREHVDEAALSPMARTFWLDNKRVDNQRIKDLLGKPLLYPNYKAGMIVLWQSGEGKDKT